MVSLTLFLDEIGENKREMTMEKIKDEKALLTNFEKKMFQKRRVQGEEGQDRGRS